MPFADDNTAGFARAHVSGRDIPEIDYASGGLGSNDCHFGLNGDVSSVVGNGDINFLGPRAIDLSVRGGIVAETLWEEYCNNPQGPHSKALAGFLLSFDDIGSSKILAQKNMRYPAGAKISGTDVGTHKKYRAGANDKSMGSLTNSGKEGSLFQLGTRWSKIAIETTVRNKGTVHFHLDGMGDLHDIVNKQGDFSYNVTSRELRYVHRNWGRPELKNLVVFYNGYRRTSGGTYKAVIVTCPW